jgi:hypothetical protein
MLTREATPLLLVADAGEGFHSVRLRIRDRVVARLKGWSLDAELAAGAPVDTDARRAARARFLVEPRRRAALAGYWENLIAAPQSRPVRRDRIVAARPELEQMVALLRSPRPVPARGVALARVLLTDGTGPVHNGANRADLGRAIEDAVVHLDPASALLLPSLQDE